MNVLLINASRFKQPWPVIPFGMCCVASATERAGYEVRTLDLCFSKNPAREIAKTLNEFRPSVVGVSIRNIDNSAGFKTQFLLDDVRTDVIEPLKKEFIGPIVIGGAAVGINAEEILSHLDLEFAIRGDGEIAMVKFLERIEAREPLTGCPGLVVRNNGRTMESNEPARACNLNDLPFAQQWRWVDAKKYIARGSHYQVQTKRGCALKCSYCTYNKIEGKAWRLKDPEVVANEVAEIVRETGCKTIEFTDSTFNLPLAHAKAVLRAIIARGLGQLKLRTMGMNPGAVDEELVLLMKNVGFSEVDVGAEACSDTALKGLGKNFRKESIEKTGAFFRKHRIPVTWYLLAGAPGETRATLRETFDSIDTIASPWDLVNVGVGLRVYKGAPVADTMDSADGFLAPVTYEPEGMSLAEVKALVKERALSRTNWFMYDEDEDKTPPALTAIVAKVFSILAPRQPLWRAFIAMRKVQGMFGVSALKRFFFRRAAGAIIEPAAQPVPSANRFAAVQQGRLSQRLSSISRNVLEGERRKAVERASGEITVSLASTRKDFEAALRLIYEQYLAYGYQEPNGYGMRVNVWNALPGTYVLAATAEEKVAGTATFIMDSDAGLPTDEVSKEQLDKLRSHGRKLCEVSGLAVSSEESSSVIKTFRCGIKLAISYLGADDFVMTVNPRHEKFYTRILLFEKLGESCEYSKVKGAPGVTMRLDLRTMERRYLEKYGSREGSRNLHRFFFVDGMGELSREIERSLAARRELLTTDFLLSTFYNRTDVLKDPASYATFAQQWFEHYMKTTAPSTFFGELSSTTRRWTTVGSQHV